MADHTVKRIDDMEAIFYGAFRRAGAELGVTSFGMNVFEMPPGAGEQYPEHTHESDGQEEVYVVLRGSGRILVDGHEHALDPETMVRVGAGATRKIFAGDDGLRCLALGGVPEQVYTRPEVFQKGAPDPTAQG